MKGSYIARAISRDGSARAFFEDSTAIVEHARQIHKASKTMTAALGRCLTAASVMGSMLKEEKGSLTLRLNGDGPCEGIVCVSDSGGNVRGCCGDAGVELPANEKGKLDVGGAIGKNGSIYVVRDTGKGEPYVGSAPLTNGEVAEDITGYFAQSEQTPTACALGVRVFPDGQCRAAGGMLLQLMPFADEQTSARLQNNVESLESISLMLAEGAGAKEVFEAVFSGVPYEILEEKPVEYRCACRREGYASALVSLGTGELEDMLSDGEPIEIICRFCGRRYEFSMPEIEELCRQAQERVKRYTQEGGQREPGSVD